MPAMLPIARPPVAKVIVDQIKKSLLDGALKPGQRLPSEQEMAEQLMVGRSSVREAMKMLAALGVVEVRQGDGTYVANGASPALLDPLVFALLIQAGTSEDLRDLRQMIELGYCELAAARSTEADFARLEEILRVHKEVASSPDASLEQLMEMDLQFHYAIIDMTGNPLVATIARTVESLFFASSRRTNHQGERTMEWHSRILAALRTREPAEIRRVLTEGLQVGHLRRDHR